LHALNIRVEWLAEEGFIAICSANGWPSAVVAHGWARWVLGTSPLAYAIPTGHEPIVFDWATSEAPYFEIMNAYKNNKPLRKDIAVDSTWEMTTDPHKAVYPVKNEWEDPVTNLLAMGGWFKWYAIMLLLEVLTSALVGSPSSDQRSADFDAKEQGSVLICVDPNSFTSSELFLQQIWHLTASIRASGKDVKVPWDRWLSQHEKATTWWVLDIDDDLREYLQSTVV
jgi:LDH2 family malate/lactate/ureidoglycolate dehydrogenase